ncbi:hypothetical protein LCGC14_0355620 [marine sediment metagenome]|uniref:Portal protein n=1 Tax=marine sediment metagenome TaxID=412755 RepID=A0A0F9T9E6_9ZZZZ
MPDILDPRKLGNVVKQGFRRARHYRRARAMFIKAYVGHYYTKKFGLVGDEPINLLFRTIAAFVPTLVMKNPVNQPSTEIVEYKQYAELLGWSLDWLDEQIDFKEILRYAITDAHFGYAVLKTGLASGGKMLRFGDTLIDEGMVYTDNIDLDDHVIDPTCRDWRKSAFEGDRNRIPRQILLDDDEFDHDLVMKLPRSRHPDAGRKVEKISQQNVSTREMDELQDMVDMVELYVPGAEALITIADPEQIIMDDFLAAREFYGPKGGPYTKLALTQPVPGNPYPVAPAGIWYDLHIVAGQMMKKEVDQMLRQKDVGVVDPGGADEAEDIRTAEDGDMVFGNPDSVKMMSFGGQNPSNEAAVRSLREWYNYMAGNPDQLSGESVGAATATGQSILQANQGVNVEDLRGMVYTAAAETEGKRAWYLHTDPLIDLPFSRRQPGGEHIQVRLTPEQRRGDWLEYTFNLKQRSMSRLDPAVRAKRIAEFGTNVLPGLCATATQAMMIGFPFNLIQAATDIADELGILEDVQDWFHDPAFFQRMQMRMAMGPQPAGKATAGPTSQPTGSPKKPSTPARERNQSFQTGIPADAQAAIQGAY